MDGTVEDQRLARLHSKLKARTHPDGTPRKNYESNVSAIKAEITRLEEKAKWRETNQ